MLYLSGHTSRRFWFAALCTVSGFGLELGAQGTAPAGAPAASPAAQPPADVVPAHDTLTVSSKILGEPRRINVYMPAAYRTSSNARFPVLYMPDGGIDEDFPHVANTVDSLIKLRKIRPVIIVGIPNTERRRDLTGPTRIGSDSAIAKRVGGSQNFRAFIRDELFPAINARYRTTDERSIVGESLAGLFVLETLLLEPALFTHYVAFDGSLWWNKGALVEASAGYIKSLGGQPRTLHYSASSEDIDALNTRFSSILKMNSPKSLMWEFTPRPDLKHLTIFRGEGPAALAKALR